MSGGRKLRAIRSALFIALALLTSLAPRAAAQANWFGATHSLAKKSLHGFEEMSWDQVVSDTANIPTEVLKCPDGELPVGVQYRKGKAVDAMNLVCAVPMFENGGYATVQSGSAMGAWVTQTPMVGGRGGGDGVSLICPNGMAVSGINGVNRLMDGQTWILADIGLDCGKLLSIHGRWQVPRYVKGSAGTPHSRGTRTVVWDGGNLDRYGWNFALSGGNPDRLPFEHYCPATPLEGLEVAFAEWNIGGVVQGVLGRNVIIYGFRWTCF